MSLFKFSLGIFFVTLWPIIFIPFFLFIILQNYFFLSIDRIWCVCVCVCVLQPQGFHDLLQLYVFFVTFLLHFQSLSHFENGTVPKWKVCPKMKKATVFGAFLHFFYIYFIYHCNYCVFMQFFYILNFFIFTVFFYLLFCFFLSLF